MWGVCVGCVCGGGGLFVDVVFVCVCVCVRACVRGYVCVCWSHVLSGADSVAGTTT